MLPAAIDTEHVRAFCDEVAPGQQPVSVSCEPLANQPMNECFAVIPQHVLAAGGEQLLGWAIWEYPGIFIEAEFHAVWRDPSGRLLDLSPRPIAFDKITFLPDQNAEYCDRQVDNIRKPLIDDPSLTRFLYLAKKRFNIMNTGDLADQHGQIALPKKLMREYERVLKEMLVLQGRLQRRYPT